MKPRFFATPAGFRRWLAGHHASAGELWVGFHKRDTGLPSITWPESVDEALCFGWIDGLRRSLGETAYEIRFTPRKPGSTWSAINIAKVATLEEAGRMTPAGRAAFARRSEARSAIYSYEKAPATLAEAEQHSFRESAAAFAFFEAQPPSYRRTATHWVVDAKQAATRARRLATLIADSASGLRIKHLRPLRAALRPGTKPRPKAPQPR